MLDPLKSDCRDKNPECALWASWESNECDKNPGYMKVNCPRSCGVCTLESIGGDEL